jgi:hypothetical protein
VKSLVCLGDYVVSASHMRLHWIGDECVRYLGRCQRDTSAPEMEALRKIDALDMAGADSRQG